MSLTQRTSLRFINDLTDECQRTMQFLKVTGYPRLYYLSYLLRDIKTIHIWGRLGNINNMNISSPRNMYCDCRVGSYRFDQVMEGGLEDNDSENETYEYVDMPTGNDSDALKFHVWKLTDGRYREAVRQYLRKKSQYITYVNQNDGLASFRRSKPNIDHQYLTFPPVDKNKWKEFIKKSSRVIKEYPLVKNSWVEFRTRDITRIFVNSEGSQLIDQKRLCELCCELWMLSSTGESIRNHVVYVTAEEKELPSLKTFISKIKNLIRQLELLSKAPTLKSYAGPVLLAPIPSGILFHEILGHRLEGSRLLSTQEGQTFKRDLGKQILPPFVSISDDPTENESYGIKTIGNYKYDDEGSPAVNATLIDHGKLVGFLNGRSPISRHDTATNGHSRNEYHERPISRMANFKVISENPVTDQELKKRFIEEIKRQKTPYGIIILDAEGGETSTDTYDFQAFLGNISLAMQVWPNGKENYIRNLSFVGTPLSSLRNIIAMGDSPVCQNSFCGGESGVIPVSTSAPAILLSNLEMQATNQRKSTQYFLPMPFEKTSQKK